MRFIVSTRRLESDDGKLIKTFDCPMQKQWNDLMPWTNHWQDRKTSEHKRLCGACGKCVVNFEHFRENQIVALVQASPETCAYLPATHPDLTEIVGDPAQDNRVQGYKDASCIRTQSTISGERIIKTARSLIALRQAVDQGFRPYFVPNSDSGMIHQKLAVIFDKDSSNLLISGDFRSMMATSQEYIDERYGKGAGIFLRQDFSRHPSPIAAYLLPNDIQEGERVFLEDLIEDRMNGSWNQGDTYRAANGYGFWRGDHLQIEQAVDKDAGPMIVG